jgi:type IV secretory pathway ATPase VirB11/archaellum biosynthesis ATPase
MMQAVADSTRIENGKAMAIDSDMNGSSDRFELRQKDAEESPIGMHASAPFEQHERSNRLEVKLRRELGEQVLALLAEERTEDVVLNPDSSLWVKRMGEGFIRFGHMPSARAASALGTIAAWRGTVLNHEQPILETELPIDGSRFEGITAPVVRQPVFAIRLRPRKIFSLDEYEAGGIVTGKDDPLNRHRCGQDFAASVRGLRHAEIIRAAVSARKNILIAGSAGSGKTTLANGILRELAQLTPHDRVLVIEDTTELQCSVANYVDLHTAGVPLHTLNLADMLPITSVWAGLRENPSALMPKNSPPLLYAATTGATPFRFHLHVSDLGHTIVVGPSSAGKSTLLGIIAAQWFRYANAQVFFFDKGYSSWVLTHAVPGGVARRMAAPEGFAAMGPALRKSPSWRAGKGGFQPSFR